VAGVAYAVGFEDPKYFSRVFSEEFGASPGEYRQSAPK
jgi:AraC-like DNA-binding protein